VAFKPPHAYEYTVKLCTTLTEEILNHVNPNVRGIEQEEGRLTKHKTPKLGGGEDCDSSAD
jgi:hypothetical protein